MGQQGHAVALLPPLRCGESAWCFPLSESAAVYLEAALLACPAAHGRVYLHKAIAGDPSLAAWISCRALLAGFPLPRTCVAAAHWCWESLADHLQGSSCQLSPSDARDVMRPAIEVLQRAKAALPDDSAPENDAAYFTSLLTIMPAWLRTANWDGSARPADEETLATLWQQACAARVDREREDCPAAEGDFESLPADSPVPPVGERLTALACRLAAVNRRIANFAERLEIAKLDALKELAYGASHEINNPLANISARAQTLLRDEEDPERQRMLVAIQSQAMRAHEMISDLMLFARPPQLCVESCDLVQLVRSVVEDAATDAASQQTTLEWHTQDKEVSVEADRTQLVVAIRSLITNALEALVGGGRVTVQIESHPAPRDLAWDVVVADNGPGMSDRVRRHLFDPFFSGREAGRGLGFGLSKCWRIAQQHGGCLFVDSRLGWGTTMRLSLPAARDSHVRRQPETPAVC